MFSFCVHGKENKKDLVKIGSRKDENIQNTSLPDKNDNKPSMEATNSPMSSSDKAMEQCSSIESIQDISNQLVVVLPPHNNNDIIIMRNDIKVISGQNMEESEIDSRLFVLDEQGTITLSDSEGTNTVIFTDQQDTQNLVLTSKCDTASEDKILDSQSSCDENVFLTDNQDSIILAENNVCGNILVEEVIEASDIMNDDAYSECNINNNISEEEVLTADGNIISLKESDESLDSLGEGSDILIGCQTGKDPVLSDAEGGKLNLTDNGGEDDLVLVDGCEDESDDGEGSLTLSSQHSADQIYDYASII